MIIPIGSDVTASLNDHIIFECYSNEPVYWIFPWDVDRQHVWEPPRLLLAIFGSLSISKRETII